MSDETRRDSPASGVHETLRLILDELDLVIQAALDGAGLAWVAEVDITTDDSRVDLAAAGYDAGIQFGEYIAQDMVAVRVSPDLRPAVIGARAYFDSHPKPASPRDLLNHRCIRFRHRGESVYTGIVRMGEAPRRITVDLVDSTAAPGGGVGEPGVAPVAPAIAIAIFALTGKRFRELPLSKSMTV